MRCDLSVLEAEDVVESYMLARSNTELALADAKHFVAISHYQVQFVVYHHHVVLGHPLECSTQSVQF